MMTTILVAAMAVATFEFPVVLSLSSAQPAGVAAAVDVDGKSTVARLSVPPAAAQTQATVTVPFAQNTGPVTMEWRPGREPVQSNGVTARFIPLPIALSEGVTGDRDSGDGGGYGDWQVSVCNTTNNAMSVPRELILELVPLRYLPDEYAARLLGDKTKRKRGKWEVIAGVATLAGGAATATGIGGAWSTSTTNQYVAMIGSAMTLGIPLIKRFAEAKVEEAPVYQVPNPLPAVVGVQAHGCVSHNFLAAKVRGAKVIGPLNVRMP